MHAAIQRTQLTCSHVHLLSYATTFPTKPPPSCINLAPSHPNVTPSYPNSHPSHPKSHSHPSHFQVTPSHLKPRPSHPPTSPPSHGQVAPSIRPSCPSPMTISRPQVSTKTPPHFPHNHTTSTCLVSHTVCRHLQITRKNEVTGFVNQWINVNDRNINMMHLMHTVA
jgi:hypothetical protein